MLQDNVLHKNLLIGQSPLGVFIRAKGGQGTETGQKVVGGEFVCLFFQVMKC